MSTKVLSQVMGPKNVQLLLISSENFCVNRIKEKNPKKQEIIRYRRRMIRRFLMLNQLWSEDNFDPDVSNDCSCIM